jgi:hypothetical protein
MRAHFTRFLFVGLGLLFAGQTGCVRKGDTYVGTSQKSSKKADEDAGASPSRPASKPDTADDDVADDDTTDDDVADDDIAADDGVLPGDDDSAMEPEPSSTADDDTSAAPSGPSGAAGANGGGEPEPAQPAVQLGACAEGLTPGTSEPVQLTQVAGSKRGLQVSAGPDGFFAVWQAAGVSVEVGYQAFAPDFAESYAASKVPNASGVSSRPAATYDAARDAFALAYDRDSTVRLRWVDGKGMASDTIIDTGLIATGSALHLAVEGSYAFVSTMSSGTGCPGTGTFGARAINVDTEVSDTPPIPPCVLATFGSFAIPGTGFGYFVQPLADQASVAFLPLDALDMAPSSAALQEVDITGGVVAGFDGTRVVLVAHDGSDLTYARFNPDGSFVGETTIYSGGNPASLAVSDTAMGVVAEADSSVEFFAQATGGGKSINPPAVVAARPGLSEPLLVAFESDFYLFFLAPDDDGDPQVFGTPIECQQE